MITTNSTVEEIRGAYMEIKSAYLAKFPKASGQFETTLRNWAQCDGRTLTSPFEWYCEVKVQADCYLAPKAAQGSTCGKCSGKGRINGFDHYADGVCFDCDGTGKL